MKRLLAIALIAGLGFSLGCDDGSQASTPTKPVLKKQSPAEQSSGPTIGEAAPEIEGVDLEGVAFKLSDYRGKVVMLDFYGDW